MKTMMTRETEILGAANPLDAQFHNEALAMKTNGSWQFGFVCGANWADRHPNTIDDTSKPMVTTDTVPTGAVLQFGKHRMVLNCTKNAQIIRDILFADNYDEIYQPIGEQLTESTIAQVLKAFFDAELDEDDEGVNKYSDFSHIASEIKKYMENELEGGR